jgi:hypothetical protein
MLKPICLPCHRFFRPKKTGLMFTEGMPRPQEEETRAAPIGNRDPSQWEPYKVWSGDLWECPDCHAEIIVGTGRDPVSQNYMPDFAKWHAIANTVQINDC